MTKKLAIKHARAIAHVSFHSRQGCYNHYVVRVFDCSVNAWREGYPRQYSLAVQLCCETKMNYARKLLNKEPLPFENYRGKRWESLV